MAQPLPNQTPYPDQLNRVKQRMAELTKGQPEVMKAFSRLHHAAGAAAALDPKTKELIALAIGVAARCDGCIAFHTHDAVRAGASDAEILDALGVAIFMGGGPSVMYAIHVVEAMEQFRAAEGRAA
jgi:AhpD family alkylhydroperoxidase